jgi:hypothetical protein
VTPAPHSLRPLLDGVRRTLRRDTALALGLAVLCAVPAALVVAWLIGFVKPWSRPGFGPLLLDILVFAAAAAAIHFGMRRWLRTLDENAVAADAERTAGMREGTVRGVLELSRQVPEGTSAGLARRAESEIARSFADVRPEHVAAGLRARSRRRQRNAAAAFAALSLTAVLLGFATPEHSRAAWAPLAAPVRNLTPPALPALSLLPGTIEVQRGADLDVTIGAAGRAAVTLHWRMQGDVPRHEVARVLGDSASVTIPRIDAPVEYWAVAPDGASTARHTITPTDALLLADLSIDVVYPGYVQRATEHFQGEIPPLEVPEGTQLIVRGRATRPLSAIGLLAADAAASVQLNVTDASFDGVFVPRSSGIYAWHVRDAAGGDAAVRPTPLEIVVVRDAAPHVDITFPATDTLLDASLRQAVVADARDDYGLASASLVSWRVDRTGRAEPEVEQAIAIGGDDRAVIRALLDAAQRSLVPGDTLKFFVRVTDASPRRQSAVSRTIALRLPGMSELRERTSEQANALLDEAERLARTAEELQQTTRDLERRASASNARRRAEQQRSRSEASSKMDFQEASASRQMLERQEELVARMEQMREQLEAFERAMERAGLRDAELQQRLEEMRRLMDETLTPEMREQLEQLRTALDELDPEALEKALEQMAEQQDEMRKQLDQTLEQMRKAAAEQEMNNLAQEARELATQQQALAESMAEKPPTAEQAKTQQQLAERTGQLAESLEQIQQQLREQGEQQTADSTQQAQRGANEAANRMQQAARDAGRKDGGSAAQKGQQAAEQLEQAAQTLDQARQDMADAWKQQAQQSVDQATRDALSLAERQQELLDRMKQAEAQQQQGGQQPGAQPQPGQQQAGQQGQQQSGQQQGAQQGQQQGGQQQGGQQQGQQQGGQQGQQQGQQGGQQQGGQMPGQGQQGGGGSGGSTQSMSTEQSALQQGLQQLGRNLQEGGENATNREVGSSLARANLSMQQTMEELQRGRIPSDQAQQSVDALNRLALSLLNNAQNRQQGESGESGEATQQMADLARKQGALNGRTNALSPMDVTQNAMGQQLNRMSAEQMEIARRLGDLNRGGREGLNGDIDALAREAEELARQMQQGRMPPEALARQERLFHRMLDAGRTLEKDEIDDERSAERPPRIDARSIDALDPSLFRDPTRFRAPTAAELQSLPPAYRRLTLDYFERLNRPLPPLPDGAPQR